MDVKNTDTYQYLITKFKKEKLSSRHQWLTEFMMSWLEQHDYTSRVSIVSESLDHVVIDYFVDIDRLKEFTGIELVNEVKIYSYLGYWMLRRKPLQITADGNASDLVFVNEELVADFLLSFLYANPENVSIVNSQKEKMGMFEDTLRYFLKYRTITPQVIEIMLLSFQAGRGYQFSIDYRK